MKGGMGLRNCCSYAARQILRGADKKTKEVRFYA